MKSSEHVRASKPINLFAADWKPSRSEHPCAAELRRWIVEYLCQSHPDLGRPGPVCPYTRRAVASRYLWAAFIEGDEIDRSASRRSSTT